jgi:hypothetical protein
MEPGNSKRANDSSARYQKSRTLSMSPRVIKVAFRALHNVAGPVGNGSRNAISRSVGRARRRTKAFENISLLNVSVSLAKRYVLV